jgi:hypothetical protein
LEWEEATPTVVALAQGTTSKLRLKHGTSTLLSTPQDDSFGNGIVPMGAITKLGYEVSWIGGDCQLRGPDGKNLDVEVVNGCPLIDCKLGMKLISELEHENSNGQSDLATAGAGDEVPQFGPDCTSYGSAETRISRSS